MFPEVLDAKRDGYDISSLLYALLHAKVGPNSAITWRPTYSGRTVNFPIAN